MLGALSPEPLHHAAECTGITTTRDRMHENAEAEHSPAWPRSRMARQSRPRDSEAVARFGVDLSHSLSAPRQGTPVRPTAPFLGQRRSSGVLSRDNHGSRPRRGPPAPDPRPAFQQLAGRPRRHATRRSARTPARGPWPMRGLRGVPGDPPRAGEARQWPAWHARRRHPRRLAQIGHPMRNASIRIGGGYRASSP